jgi:hypothetical protein
MNYSFNFGLVDSHGGMVFDYSRSLLLSLDEAALVEAAGIGGTADLVTKWWGPQPNFRFAQASSPFRPADAGLDWNQNGRLDGGLVGMDVNSDGVCVGPGPDSRERSRGGTSG